MWYRVPGHLKDKLVRDLDKVIRDRGSLGQQVDIARKILKNVRAGMVNILDLNVLEDMGYDVSDFEVVSNKKQETLGGSKVRTSLRRKMLREKLMRRMQEREEMRKRVVSQGLVNRKRDEVGIGLAEQVIKAVKLYRQMFTEQEEDDELMDIDKGLEMGDEMGDELMKELDSETVGEDIEKFVDVVKEKGGDEIEVEVTDDFAVKVANGEEAVVIRLAVDDGEPQLVLTTDDSESKITVSLAPVIGAVTSEEDIINSVVDDEEVKEEVTEFIVDLVTEGEAETEVTTDFEDMIGGKGEDETEPEGEEDIEFERGGEEDVEKE